MALPLTLESTEVIKHVPPELQLNSIEFRPTSAFICFIWLNYKQQLFPYTAPFSCMYPCLWCICQQF